MPFFTFLQIPKYLGDEWVSDLEHRCISPHTVGRVTQGFMRVEISLRHGPGRFCEKLGSTTFSVDSRLSLSVPIGGRNDSVLESIILWKG
jgi:hypothetical protein